MKDTVSFQVMKLNEGKVPSFSYHCITVDLLSNYTGTFYVDTPFYFLASFSEEDFTYECLVSDADNFFIPYKGMAGIFSKVEMSEAPLKLLPIEGFSLLGGIPYQTLITDSKVDVLHPSGRYYYKLVEEVS